MSNEIITLASDLGSIVLGLLFDGAQHRIRIIGAARI